MREGIFPTRNRTFPLIRKNFMVIVKDSNFAARLRYRARLDSFLVLQRRGYSMKYPLEMENFRNEDRFLNIFQEKAHLISNLLLNY